VWANKHKGRIRGVGLIGERRRDNLRGSWRKKLLEGIWVEKRLWRGKLARAKTSIPDRGEKPTIDGTPRCD